jgi:uncharacterized membrane protein YphA (DoxX/SURF4 family)
MKKIPFPSWTFIVSFIILSVIHLWSVNDLPFHPDETSTLYQSRDFDLFISDPKSLIWSTDLVGNYDQTYRELNAPLSKYVLGLGRWIGEYPSSSVSTDWDWSLSWEENERAGALPSLDLLWNARFTITLFLPLSILFIYLTGVRIGGEYSGLAALIFFGTNALILLHGRRAMYEGVLIFGVIFCLWSFLHAEKRPWLAGLAVALAISSKYSAAALFPVGLLSVVWISSNENNRWRKIVRNLFQYLSIFILVLYILHPIAWKDPISIGLKMLETRLEFTEGQIATAQELAPHHVMTSPVQRVGAMLAQLFINPVSFYEAGNYKNETAPAESNYMSNPGNTLFRSIIGGGFLLLLTLGGIAFSLLHLVNRDPIYRRNILLLGIASIIQATTLLIAVPIPTQRYYIPLVPFICLWAGLAIGLPTLNHKKETDSEISILENPD